MDYTQSALGLLVFFWVLQIAGSWTQWRHYRGALSAATSRESDGFLGMGQHKPRFRAGAIAILEVDPGLRVRRLQMMSGISIFARFKPQSFASGWTLGELGAYCAPGPNDNSQKRAIRQALKQVEEVHTKKK